MRVLLIWPYYGDVLVDYIPISFAYLKANVGQGKHDISVLDTVLENLPPDSKEFVEAVARENPDVIGFSLTSNKFANTVSYARKIKSVFPSIPIVVGGVHVTSYVNETMNYSCFDYGFVGESEFSFPMFLDALESGVSLCDIPGLCFRKPNGDLVCNPPLIPEKLDLIKRPDYEAIGLKRYYEIGYNFMHSVMEHAPIWISRGCPYTCRFCSAPDLNGRKVRYHSPDYVETWIRELHQDFGVKHFNIIDDNFTYEMDKAKEILNTLVKVKSELKDISFAFPNGIRMQRVDEEMLQLIKKAGFTYIIYAPESGSKEILKLMRKGLKPEIIEPSIRLAKKVGLKVLTFWIVGYPGETLETMEETRKMIMSCGTDMIGLHMFRPLPGTPVFDELVQKGEITRSYLPHSYQEISDNDYITSGLSKKQILSFIRKVYFQHYFCKPLHAWALFEIIGFKRVFHRFKQFYLHLDELKQAVFNRSKNFMRRACVKQVIPLTKINPTTHVIARSNSVATKQAHNVTRLPRLISFGSQ